MRDKEHVKRLLERIESKLYHKWLKVQLIRQALNDPSGPVYWDDFEPAYAEVNRLYEEVLKLSKRLAEERLLKARRRAPKPSWSPSRAPFMLEPFFERKP